MRNVKLTGEDIYNTMMHMAELRAKNTGETFIHLPWSDLTTEQLAKWNDRANSLYSLHGNFSQIKKEVSDDSQI
jgi:hypothetical protein